MQGNETKADHCPLSVYIGHFMQWKVEISMSSHILRSRLLLPDKREVYELMVIPFSC